MSLSFFGWTLSRAEAKTPSTKASFPSHWEAVSKLPWYFRKRKWLRRGNAPAPLIEWGHSMTVTTIAYAIAPPFTPSSHGPRSRIKGFAVSSYLTLPLRGSTGCGLFEPVATQNRSPTRVHPSSIFQRKIPAGPPLIHALNVLCISNP